jgi:hypothetical protein
MYTHRPPCTHTAPHAHTHTPLAHTHTHTHTHTARTHLFWIARGLEHTPSALPLGGLLCPRATKKKAPERGGRRGTPANPADLEHYASSPCLRDAARKGPGVCTGIVCIVEFRLKMLTQQLQTRLFRQTPGISTSQCTEPGGLQNAIEPLHFRAAASLFTTHRKGIPPRISSIVTFTFAFAHAPRFVAPEMIASNAW